jgi:uncharacterized membrane protein (UPF0127 family)
MKRLLTFVIGSTVFFCGCDWNSEAKYILHLGGQEFRVEVVDTFETKAQGMSGRKHLAQDSGMLFVQQFPTMMTMWMKDCYIPLDVLFFDRDCRLINYHTMPAPQPGTPEGALPRYRSDKPVKYALELPAGTAQRLGLGPGDIVSFSPDLLNRLGQSTE